MAADDVDGISLPCCACGGEASFFIPPPGSERQRVLLAHSLPSCRRFEEAESPDAILKYLRDCRLAITPN